jgi:hypothetical protein
MNKCVRCGYCCIAGCCHRGEESKETGVCKNLIVHEDNTTSCSLVLEGDDDGITIGGGCVLQESKSAYSYYKEEYEPIKPVIRRIQLGLSK